MRRRAREYDYSSDTTSSDKPPSTRPVSDADALSFDTPLFRRIFRGLHARADDMSAFDTPSPTCFHSDISSTDTPPSPSLRRT